MLSFGNRTVPWQKNQNHSLNQLLGILSHLERWVLSLNDSDVGRDDGVHVHATPLAGFTSGTPAALDPCAHATMPLFGASESLLYHRSSFLHLCGGPFKWLTTQGAPLLPSRGCSGFVGGLQCGWSMTGGDMPESGVVSQVAVCWGLCPGLHHTVVGESGAR